MRIVNGIALPEGDTHFERHLNNGPLFAGKGTYQFAKIQAALGQVPLGRRGLALDIGGHVGLWSRVLSANFDRVMAFEPSPHLWRFFRENAPCAELIEVALGDKVGNLEMAVVVENSGNGHIAGAGHPVPVMTLDVWCASRVDAPRIDFIKIDVEGYELEVVRGARETILRDKPVLVVEQKEGNAERYGHGQWDAIRTLCSWGYEAVWVKSGDHCLVWAGK